MSTTAETLNMADLPITEQVEGATVVAVDTAGKSRRIDVETLLRNTAGQAEEANIDLGGIDFDATRLGNASIGEEPSYYRVMSNGRNVGVLMMFSDLHPYMVTQILYTHLQLTEEGELDTSFTPGVSHLYTRSYHLVQSSSEQLLNTWSQWGGLSDYYTKEETYDRETIDQKVAAGGTFDPTVYYNKTDVDERLAEKLDTATYNTEKENFATKSEVEAVDAKFATKQDKLTPGTGVEITPNGTINVLLDNELFTVVSALPASGVSNKIYLVPASESETNDAYIEYGYVGGSWERLGQVNGVNLEQYYTKTTVDGLLEQKAEKSTVDNLLPRVTTLEGKASSHDTSINTLSAGLSTHAEQIASINDTIGDSSSGLVKKITDAEDVAWQAQDFANAASGTADTLNTIVGDKTYDSANKSGLARKNLPNKTTLTSSDFSTSNTIYVIQYDYTISGTIDIPDNCVLKFDGGSLSNGTIQGNNTRIDAGKYEKIFNVDVTLTGTWDVEKISVCWFGAKNDYNNGTFSYVSSRASIQKVLDFGPETGLNNIYIPKGVYYVDSTLYMASPKNIILEGKSNNIFLNHLDDKKGVYSCAILYTDQNIDFLNIDIDPSLGVASSNNEENLFHISITGGQIDVSLAGSSYTSKCISTSNVNGGTNIWGFDINTSLIAEVQSIHNDSRAIYFDLARGGFVTMVRTSGYIWFFGYGISTSETFEYGGWFTDLKDTSRMKCGHHFWFPCHNVCGTLYIDGSYQAYRTFSTLDNGEVDSYFNCTNVQISGKFWDYNQAVTSILYTAQYPIEIGPNSHFSTRFSENCKSLLKRGVKNPHYVLSELPEYDTWNSNPFQELGYNHWENCLVSDGGFTVTESKSDNLTIYGRDYLFLDKVQGNQCTLTITDDNYSNAYYEITITFPSVKYFNLAGVYMSAYKRFQCSFGKVELTLKNGGSTTGTYSILCNSTRPGSDSQTWFIPISYDAHIAATQLVFRFSDLTPAEYGSDKNCLIYSIFARETMHSYSKVLKTDGIGLRKIVSPANIARTIVDFNPVSIESLDTLYGSRSGFDIIAHITDGYIGRNRFVTKNTDGIGAIAVEDLNQLSVVGGYPTWIPRNQTLCFCADVFTRRVFHIMKGRNNDVWLDYDGAKANTKRSGTTEERPTSADLIYRGFAYYDTTIQKQIFYGGTAWVESDGAPAGIQRFGPTNQRPDVNTAPIGFCYFDATLGKPIWNNAGDWVDATGQTV